MGKPLRILFVEDSLDDMEMLLRELKQGGYDPTYERVETATAMKVMLENHAWDIILADHSMPFFSAIGALTQLQLSGLDIPFIIVSGSIGEDSAVTCMKTGAHDYIMKDKLARLVPAIEREMTDAEERRRRKRAEEALRKSETSLANAQRIARVGNWEWDIVKNEVHWSDEKYRIFGVTPETFSPTYEAFLATVHSDDREFVKNTILETVCEGMPFSVDYRIILPNGSERIIHSEGEVVIDNAGKAVYMSGTVQDITERKKIEDELRVINESLEQRVVERTSALAKTNKELRMEIEERKRMEEQIKHMAFHDALTGLPNRALFTDRLALVVAHAHRAKENFAVLFLDLDRFKAVNDTLGHTAGDQLLREIADRLKGCVREEDTVARFAGDEFTLLLLGVVQSEHVINIVRKILSVVKQPVTVGNHKLYATASIGIALYPSDGEDAETLLKSADAAMYHAKEQGRNKYQFYTPSMHAKSLEKMVLEHNLRRALDQEEFVVHYQPLVNISTGQIVSLEALVRWRHPDQGLIHPEKFLSLSESTRLIIFIDELVLYTVCVQCKDWLDAGFQPSGVAVNISAHTFQQSNFVETVMSILEKTGMNPQLLGLEITEGIAMHDVETTIHKLNRLNELGIQIAIDDFGTGFSSLYYLKKFPIHKLKISQHFVNGIVTDQHDKLIVASVIALAQSMKFKVVAEGVETEEQLTFLKQRQCDEMQGYLFCKPLPAEAFGKVTV